MACAVTSSSANRLNPTSVSGPGCIGAAVARPGTGPVQERRVSKATTIPRKRTAVRWRPPGSWMVTAGLPRVSRGPSRRPGFESAARGDARGRAVVGLAGPGVLVVPFPRLCLYRGRGPEGSAAVVDPNGARLVADHDRELEVPGVGGLLRRRRDDEGFDLALFEGEAELATVCGLVAGPWVSLVQVDGEGPQLGLARGRAGQVDTRRRCLPRHDHRAGVGDQYLAAGAALQHDLQPRGARVGATMLMGPGAEARASRAGSRRRLATGG